MLLLALAGCGGDDGYDPDLAYPPRADPVVLAAPPSAPVGREEPGRWDDWLLGLNTVGGVARDPATLPPPERDRLHAALTELFGTPKAPHVEAGPEAAGHAARLGLTPGRLAAGSRTFRRVCADCHGLTGDGRGPTGRFSFPHPRDFRRGVFEYVSAAGGKPTRADLTRVIRHGVVPAGMPKFDLLADDEVDTLVGYVVLLSARGQAEFEVLRELLGDDPPDDAAAAARAKAAIALRQWAEADGNPLPVPTPPAYPDDAARHAAAARGHALFVGPGGCAKCHQNYGRADAPQFDVTGNVVRPADLTAGEFRGGGDPADLFRRVRLGIPASNMPAAVLTDAQTWDVVEFVRSLPLPHRLPPTVRAVAYP